MELEMLEFYHLKSYAAVPFISLFLWLYKNLQHVLGLQQGFKVCGKSDQSTRWQVVLLCNLLLNLIEETTKKSFSGNRFKCSSHYIGRSPLMCDLFLMKLQAYLVIGTSLFHGMILCFFIHNFLIAIFFLISH